MDFYHLSEYLAAAAPRCAPETPAPWLTPQQTQLKPSNVAAVQAALAPHVEAEEVADHAAPVRCCACYLTNRPGQFDYQRALAAELPIGSGEISFLGATWKVGKRLAHQ